MYKFTLHFAYFSPLLCPYIRRLHPRSLGAPQLVATRAAHTLQFIYSLHLHILITFLLVCLCLCWLLECRCVRVFAATASHYPPATHSTANARRIASLNCLLKFSFYFRIFFFFSFRFLLLPSQLWLLLIHIILNSADRDAHARLQCCHSLTQQLTLHKLLASFTAYRACARQQNVAASSPASHCSCHLHVANQVSP